MEVKNNNFPWHHVDGSGQTIYQCTCSSVASHCKCERKPVAQTKSHYLCSGPTAALVDVRIVIKMLRLFMFDNISSDHRCFSSGIFGWSPSLCHTSVEELTLMRTPFNLVRYDPFTVTGMNRGYNTIRLLLIGIGEMCTLRTFTLKPWKPCKAPMPRMTSTAVSLLHSVNALKERFTDVLSSSRQSSTRWVYRLLRRTTRSQQAQGSVRNVYPRFNGLGRSSEWQVLMHTASFILLEQRARKPW